MEDSIAIFVHQTFPDHRPVSGYWVCLLPNDKEHRTSENKQIVDNILRTYHFSEHDAH